MNEFNQRQQRAESRQLRTEEERQLEQYMPLLENAARLAPGLAVMIYFFTAGQPDLMLLSIPAAGTYDMVKYGTRGLRRGAGSALRGLGRLGDDAYQAASGALGELQTQASGAISETIDSMETWLKDAIQQYRANQEKKRREAKARFNQFIVKRTRQVVPQIDASMSELETANKTLAHQNTEQQALLEQQALQNLGLSEQLSAAERAHIEEVADADVKIDALIQALISQLRDSGQAISQADLEAQLEVIVRQERVNRAVVVRQQTEQLFLERKQQRRARSQG